MAQTNYYLSRLKQAISIFSAPTLYYVAAGQTGLPGNESLIVSVQH